ncbi:MAG: hypothetical protein SCARUB_02301 [Candidatus Scalindua rubra]|uniref:Lcl C-terminal domain-containing protein n=1 Tax=Candidatus Scalindua rubra TaxID=1872076 RepID=A0A1E3XAC3_9BACT|nr:MAG: hypothetical protein SCARUB_02301 [Candidatus Scalindua rubra]
MRKYLIKHILIISLIFISTPIVQSIEAEEKPHVNLRPYYKGLSVSEVQEMPNVAIRKKEKRGFYGHSTINHGYYSKTINGDKVVIDHATGLMWCQSGSDKYMSWKKAKNWVKELNRKSYAGYNDWRLPTLEEAASLLESDKKNHNLYIDPVFDKTQWSIWTGDSHIEKDALSLDGAWRVSFNDSIVYWSSDIYGIFYVRPVRLGK